MFFPAENKRFQPLRLIQQRGAGREKCTAWHGRIASNTGAGSAGALGRLGSRHAGPQELQGPGTTRRERARDLPGTRHRQEKRIWSSGAFQFRVDGPKLKRSFSPGKEFIVFTTRRKEAN